MEDKINKETESQQRTENGGEEDVDVLRQSLLDEKAKAEDYLANWQRSQADFINYKKRCEKEKEEIGEYSKSTVIKSILPVLDDFERAISAVPQGNVDSGWIEGVQLIERKLRNTLESLGLECIECVGECFDPYTHEAIRQACGEEGIVLEEVQKGYKLNDKVIRPSQVVVGSGETEERTDEEESYR
jgi:molecular chaperone GrpE